MDLIGQPISHKTFGPGIVTDLTEGVVTVCFQDSEKKFIYPDAFHSFLVPEDRDTLRYIKKQIKDRDTALQKARQAQLAQLDRKRKLLNFQVIPNSHAVFNLPPDQLEQAVGTWRVSTGTYLSGYSKGQPRIADRMSPNSVCLLTVRPDRQAEGERRIVGAFMVQEDFFGEDAQDGAIAGHPQHRMLIPPRNRMPFWKYFSHDAPPRWGNTVFKYCSGDIMNQILADMTEVFRFSPQEEASTDFYRYFCEMNRLRPLIELPEESCEEQPEA